MFLSVGHLRFSSAVPRCSAQRAEIAGTWKRFQRGILLLDNDGNAFAMVVSKPWGERFTVSVQPSRNGLKVMHCLDDQAAKRFGFSTLSENLRASEKAIAEIEQGRGAD